MDCGISAGELDGLQEGLEMQEKAELQEKMLIQKRLKLQELRPEVLTASEFGLSAGELERLLLQRLLYRREEKLARLQERLDMQGRRLQEQEDRLERLQELWGWGVWVLVARGVEVVGREVWGVLLQGLRGCVHSLMCWRENRSNMRVEQEQGQEQEQGWYTSELVAILLCFTLIWFW